MTSHHEPSPPSQLPPSTLQAARTGNLNHLRAQLADFTYTSPIHPSSNNNPHAALSTTPGHPAVSQLVIAAADAHQAPVVRWLLFERFPEWTSFVDSHHAVIRGGPAVYEVFHEKWPHLIEWSLGLQGNPLGYCLFTGNREMVEYLLWRGADPNRAHYSEFCFSKIEHFDSWTKRFPDDIMKLLIVYGFQVPEGARWPREKNEGGTGLWDPEVQRKMRRQQRKQQERLARKQGQAEGKHSQCKIL